MEVDEKMNGTEMEVESKAEVDVEEWGTGDPPALKDLWKRGELLTFCFFSSRGGYQDGVNWGFKKKCDN
jgi:hypothetical protein